MSPRRQLSAARRRQILEAAVAVICERGLCDTRIADVGETARTSPALFIYHFDTRDRLLAEALAFSEEQFYEEAARDLATIPSTREQLVHLLRQSCATCSPNNLGSRASTAQL